MFWPLIYVNRVNLDQCVYYSMVIIGYVIDNTATTVQ